MTWATHRKRSTDVWEAVDLLFKYGEPKRRRPRSFSRKTVLQKRKARKETQNRKESVKKQREMKRKAPKGEDKGKNLTSNLSAEESKEWTASKGVT